jgi:hypothetical protein
VGGFFGLDHELQQGALGEASQVGFSGSKSHGVEPMTQGISLCDRMPDNESYLV